MLNLLNKLHEQEKQLKRELSETFLTYFDSLTPSKRLRQMESLLYDPNPKNLPTLDRRLTLQEKKCLYLATKGKEIKEMARIMGLSQRTIKYHRANIVKKLDVPNLMAAVGLGAQLQYVQSESSTATQLVDEISQMKHIINNLPADIYWKRCEGKKLIYSGMNCTGTDSLHKMGFRWKINDILGKTDKCLFDKETANTFSRNDWEVIHERVAMTKEEIAILPSGEKIIQLSSKRPLLDKKGYAIGILGVTINLSKF